LGVWVDLCGIWGLRRGIGVKRLLLRNSIRIVGRFWLPNLSDLLGTGWLSVGRLNIVLNWSLLVVRSGVVILLNLSRLSILHLLVWLFIRLRRHFSFEDISVPANLYKLPDLLTIAYTTQQNNYCRNDDFNDRIQSEDKDRLVIVRLSDVETEVSCLFCGSLRNIEVGDCVVDDILL